ncbi:MAG: extracellular solute-binding protein [Burkholderiaceae bacterium]
MFACKPSKVWSTAAFAALLTCLAGYNISSAYGNEVSEASALQGGFVSSMALGATPKYAKDFTHFSYTDPQARPGGELRLAAMGSFDKLNPFTLKGIPARGLSELVFEPLAIGSLDEPMSMYGLLAESMRLAPDELSITFRLSPKARFSNGLPVLAADVKFAFDTLRSPTASPIWRNYWADVKDAVVLDERTIRFNFLRRNRELHMTVASLPVFSKSWGGELPFDQWVMQTPVGSGPYRVARADVGKSVVYERRSDYWAQSHPARRHQFNFDRISFRYYKDVFARLEALKAGEFDFIHENTAKNWARSYRGRPFQSGELVMAELPNSNGAGLQAFFFNTRRPLFQDVRVRHALSLAMDFEWMNRQLFYDQYIRSNSYFTNSELAASGLPDEAELVLLNRLARQAKLQIDQTWIVTPVPEPPSAKGADGLRQNLREAKRLLLEAGWSLKEGRLINAAGEPFEFEILISQRNWERVIAPFARNLEKLGIRVSARVSDVSLYKKRLDNYDYDMMVHWYLSGQNPGNEMLFRFTSSSASEPGADNYAGITSPWVDALISHLIAVRNREELVTAARLLDRVLRHGHYAIPHWHNRVHRVAFRRGLRAPTQPPLYYHSEDWAMTAWWWDKP